jgi:superfamily I DNA/RNA helicase
VTRSPEELEQARQRRQQTSDDLVDSDAHKKLVVAGPGTGKTHNFRRVLEKSGGGLAITFIKALAEDLERDLGDLAQVNTFHGYCKRLAHNFSGVGGLTAKFDYFPALPQLVAEDLEILGYDRVGRAGLDRRIREMDEDDGMLPAALEIGNYYDAVGHNDVVYRVQRHFEANPESIPELDVVVVDEYQDFNYLETRLIDSLAQASPVLIAGDDDQALYGFKGSSPRFIRDLADEEDVDHFDLPYCSRCTEVVVEAVKQIAVEAQRRGNLADRIKRPYLCYLPDKAEDSDRHPALIHAACSVETSKAPYARSYIAEQIAEVPDEDIRESREGPHPTALVIGPLYYVRPICEYLAERFANVRLLESSKSGITALDGYRRLARDFDSRLGWRILLHLDPCDGASDLIERAFRAEVDLAALLPEDYREKHRGPAGLVEKLLDGQELNADEVAELEAAADMTINQVHAALGTDPEKEGDEGAEGYDEAEAENEGPTIVCTSQVGAKGLSAEHVFIVGMVNGDFPRDPNNVTDDEVCQLIVGLSRTRKACHLVSAGNWLGVWKKESAFFNWLGDIATEHRTINKDYWNE